VIANVRDRNAERMRAYGATETIDRTADALQDAVRQAHPDGLGVLIDLVDADGAAFAALASLVKGGGTADPLASSGLLAMDAETRSRPYRASVCSSAKHNA
jgi:NADPH:quinone reductase-like Zn-dependent oxidoreductase